MAAVAAPATSVIDDRYTGGARTVAASQLPSAFVPLTGGTTRAAPAVTSIYSPVYFPPLKGPIG